MMKTKYGLHRLSGSHCQIGWWYYNIPCCVYVAYDSLCRIRMPGVHLMGCLCCYSSHSLQNPTSHGVVFNECGKPLPLLRRAHSIFCWKIKYPKVFRCTMKSTWHMDTCQIVQPVDDALTYNLIDSWVFIKMRCPFWGKKVNFRGEKGHLILINTKFWMGPLMCLKPNNMIFYHLNYIFWIPIWPFSATL